MNKPIPFFIAIHLSLLLSFFSPSTIFSATQPSELSVEELFNEHVDSIVIIGALDKKESWLGSGFIVDQEGERRS